MDQSANFIDNNLPAFTSGLGYEIKCTVHMSHPSKQFHPFSFETETSLGTLLSDWHLKNSWIFTPILFRTFSAKLFKDFSQYSAERILIKILYVRTAMFYLSYAHEFGLELVLKTKEVAKVMQFGFLFAIFKNSFKSSKQ
jgi:hypothetical protein